MIKKDSNKKGGKKVYFLFLIMPLLLVVIAVFMNNARGPYWLGTNLDPEYVYLLNSLNLAQMHGVGHTDHPGTPVQVIGAGVLRIVHTLSGTPNNIETHVLEQPENYLSAINTLFIAINVLMLIFLGAGVYYLTRSIAPALWIQIAPFFSVVLLRFGLTRVTPEPLLMFASFLFILALIATMHMKLKKEFLYLGLITAFGIATKVTFLPLIVIPLIVLPTIKKKIYYLLITFAGFILFTLPIIRMYGKFIQWIISLITHTGRYGSGASNIVSSQRYFANMKFLILGNTFFSIILLIALIIIVIALFNPKMRTISLSNIQFRYLVAVVVAQVAGILIVSKHSAHHYLLPVLSLSGLLGFFIYTYLNHVRVVYNKKKRSLLIPSGLVIVVLFLIVNPITRANEVINQLDQTRKYSLEVNRVVKSNYHGYIPIYYYPSSSLEYALKFGNDLSRSYHTETLEKLYPRVYFYDIWTGRFVRFDYNTEVPFTKIQTESKGRIIFQGVSGLKIPGMKFTEVYRNSSKERIYTY